MTAAEALRAALPRLQAAGIETAARDARVLLAHAMGIAPDRLTLHLPDTLSDQSLATYETAITARLAHQPVAQITGQRLFWGRSFKVTRDTLDPRPETEILVAEALSRPFLKLLDLGTGTGCILLSCLADMPMASGVGSDLSAAALAVARENAENLGLTARAKLVQSDWFAAIPGRFDLIVSNPPYIAQDEMAGLSPDVLMASNPRLIVLRISGYGQTGPYRNRPGFGVIGEAMGGLRHLTAEPGRVPVRVGVSIGDTLSALHGVIGILLALQHRHATGQGQVIDVALYEAVFNCMESLLPEYSAFGAVREPAGSALPGIAPTNAYLCQDGAYALVAGNGDSIFKRLMALIERPDLANDPALADNAGRVARVAELDAAIGAWTAQHPVAEVLEALDKASVPAGRIYTVADIAADPHYQARGMLQAVEMDDGSTLTVPGIVPKLSATPGQHRRNAPQLGQDTDQILAEMGLTAEQIQSLKARGIVGSKA